MFTNSMCAWVHQWYNKINVGAMPQQFNFSPAIYTVFSLSGVPALLVIPLTAASGDLMITVTNDMDNCTKQPTENKTIRS